MSVIRISHPSGEVHGRIRLNGSKSISNRVLIIKSLCEDPFDIMHLSTSDDTQTLEKLLNQKDNQYDCHHAGTTFRFLTSFLAIQPGEQFLTGSDEGKTNWPTRDST